MSFTGFGPDTTRFLLDLTTNNNREWFEANRERYETHLLEPAKAFVEAVGERLVELDPDVVVDPRVNGNIFRINRDTRFSKDKTPYKDHLAFRFWTGPDKKAETSSFFVRFFHDSWGIGVGVHEFSKPALLAYREAVDHDRSGQELAKIVRDLGKQKIEVGGEEYKRVPREYDADHPRIDLLRLKGLFAYQEGPLPESFASSAFAGECADRFERMRPVHTWLKAVLPGA